MFTPIIVGKQAGIDASNIAINTSHTGTSAWHSSCTSLPPTMNTANWLLYVCLFWKMPSLTKLP